MTIEKERKKERIRILDRRIEKEQKGKPDFVDPLADILGVEGDSEV